MVVDLAGEREISLPVVPGRHVSLTTILHCRSLRYGLTWFGCRLDRGPEHPTPTASLIFRLDRWVQFGSTSRLARRANICTKRLFNVVSGSLSVLLPDDDPIHLPQPNSSIFFTAYYCPFCACVNMECSNSHHLPFRRGSVCRPREG